IGLVEWVLTRAQEIVNDICRRPLSPRDRLTQVFTTWSETLISRPAVLALLSPENISLTTEVMKRFRRRLFPRIQELVTDIAGIIREGCECGQFRKVDPKAAAQLFFAAFRSAMIGTLSGGRLPELSRTMQELFFCGLLADSGQRPRTKLKEAR
ncbi:MAG: hypothetical protein ABIK44_01535, partial [candidate division WOR-3 bacterium]